VAGDPFSDQTVVLSVLPGEVLDDRWRIESRVGQGAMGSVFKGKDLTSNEAIAIKILSPEHVRKPKVLARFEREAELMTTLRHPNIVQLYGHGRRGVLPYIAMEFLEGLTLSEVLQHLGGAMALAETVATVKQIASGLAFLHRHGLVHRDVKPQNVFMTIAGRVTILDLGVVRDLHNPGLTRPGAMVGTPYYMSPEQILGVDDIDKRTDVYALAAMTFELLTGRPPYLGSNNFEVLFGHKNSPPPSATEINKAIPKDVSQVLMRGMAKRREHRPESASELASDLEAVAGMKKVDLARSFPFLNRRRSPTAGHRSKTPRKASSEIPLARDADVASVSSASALPRRASRETKASALHDEVTSSHHARPPPNSAGAVAIPNTQEEGVNLEHVDADALKPQPVAKVAAGQLRVVAQMRGEAVKALLFVDGTSRGLTPRTVVLAEGRHELRIDKKGAHSVSRMVEVKADEVLTLRIELPSV
jgi:eukaryotic-like serine/threonine-protein kinase